MAMQIDKGVERKHIKPAERKYSKKLHRRSKRRQSKNIESANPQFNRYSDVWSV